MLSGFWKSGSNNPTLVKVALQYNIQQIIELFFFSHAFKYVNLDSFRN